MQLNQSTAPGTTAAGTEGASQTGAFRKAADTNVQETWKRFGWVPPSEAKKQGGAHVQH